MNTNDKPPCGFISWQAFDDWMFEDSFNWEPSEDADGNYIPPKYGSDEIYAKKSNALAELLGKTNEQTQE